MEEGGRLKGRVSAACVLAAVALPASAAPLAQLPSSAAAAPIIHVVFRAAGTKFLRCDPAANCIEAAVSIAWVQAANIDFARSRYAPAYWDVRRGRGQISFHTNAPCKDKFDLANGQAPVGAERVGDHLVILLGVDLADTPSGCDAIGVESGGQPLSPELQSIVNIRVDVGSYTAWLGGHQSYSANVGSKGGTVKEDPHSPGNSSAWFTWSGAVSVTESTSPPDDRPPPPAEPVLPGQPPTPPPPLPTTPTPEPTPNPLDYLGAIIGKIRDQVQALTGRKTSGVAPSLAAPGDGRLSGTVTLGGAAKAVLVARLDQPVRKGAATAVRLAFTSAGLRLLKALPGPERLRISATFTPRTGKAVTRTAVSTLTPRAAKPAVTSVQFSGGPGNPSVVVHGRNLGTLPKPDPPGHPAGQNGCPAVPGDNGYDYGTSLYLAVPAKNWAGGRYRPSLNETDCIDLVVTKFTATEVDFHFGPFYARYHSQFSLDDGDAVQIAVNGATLDVHVKYGATVTG